SPAQAGGLRAARRFICLIAALSMAAAAGRAAVAAAITIDATPIPAFDNRDPGRVRFGALEFRGGLVLTSTDRRFGGLSGLWLSADGQRLLAVSDRGDWLSGRIVYEDGRVAAIADAEMAPMRAADGRTLRARGWG